MHVIVLNILIGLLSICGGIYISNQLNRDIRFLCTIIVFVAMVMLIINGLLYIRFGWNNYYLSFLLAIYISLLLMIIDLFEKTVPVDLLILGGCVGLIMSLINPNVSFITNIIVSLIYLLIMFGFTKIIKHSIGLGDIYFLSMLAVIINVKMALSVMVIGFILSGLFGVVWLVIRKASKKTKIPFLPFLFVALIMIILL